MPSAWDDLYDSKTELLDGTNPVEPEIEVITDLEVVAYPENGTTPENGQVLFEFDKTIDASLIDSVILIRKDF